MTDKEYYNLFKEKGAIALKSKREFVAMIPRIYRNKIYKKKGFGSIFECAAKLGGVSYTVVEEVIRVDEKLADLPELKKLMPKVGLSKLRRVAGIAKKETENEWVRKVKNMSKSALETHIQDLRKSLPGHSEKIKPIYDNTFESFTVKLDPKTILKLKIIKQKMGSQATWNEVFEKMMTGAERKVAEVQVAMPVPEKKHVMKITRHVPASVRRGLPEQCQYPGCDKPAEVVHHPHRFSLRANHENLKPLCKGHHQLVHSGFVGLEPKSWLPKTARAIEHKILRLRCRSG